MDMTFYPITKLQNYKYKIRKMKNCHGEKS